MNAEAVEELNQITCTLSRIADTLDKIAKRQEAAETTLREIGHAADDVVTILDARSAA